MSWAASTRRADLPSNWRSLRLVVLQRDGWLCRIGYPCCILRATEVDHVGERTDHRPAMLRAACHPCHAKRTQRQSVDSRMRRAHIAPEPVPGVIAE